MTIFNWHLNFVELTFCFGFYTFIKNESYSTQKLKNIRNLIKKKESIYVILKFLSTIRKENDFIAKSWEMNKEERKCMQPEIYLLRDEKSKYRMY